MADEYYATIHGGRSRDKLHVDRNCRFLKNKPDEDIVSGPRERFDEDQEMCAYCAP